MLREIGQYLWDVGGYLRAAAGVGQRYLPGQGSDYRDKKYKHAAKRMVARLHPEEMTLKVVKIINETPTTKTLRLERRDGPIPPFRAGQYVNLFVEIDGVRTSRPYSISSPPGLDTIDLTVKDVGGGFVAPYLVQKVKVDDELVSSGPSGQFYHEPLIHTSELVFIAAGSGITPFMSMIRLATRQNSPLSIQLIYGSRTPEEVIFGEELAALASENKNLTVTVTLTAPPSDCEGPKGRVSPELITEHVGDPAGKTFYICGPQGLFEMSEATLLEMGAPRNRIRQESYGPPSPITKAEGWPREISVDATFEVEIVGRHGPSQVISALAGEPLLNTLERHKLVVPALCRTGDCSTCRVKVLEGDTFASAEKGLRESDRETDFVHSCVTYPLSDLKIRL